MKKRVRLLFTCLFVVCLLMELWGQFSNSLWINIFTKPLLMPLLAIVMAASLQNHTLGIFRNRLILIGLFFSWLGDVFLMLVDLKPDFFLAGLSAFLITHILYSVAFYNIGRTHSLCWNLTTFSTTIIIFISAIILLLLLWPKLGAMRIPVLVYSCCISVMAVLSLWIWLKYKSFFSSLLLLGALLFMLSDSLIAINRFHTTFDGAGFWIMLTYGLAQLFIVSGFIRFANSTVYRAKQELVE